MCMGKLEIANCGIKSMGAELACGEGLAVEHPALEFASARKSCGIGGGGGHQRRIVTIGKALGEILEICDLRCSLRLHVEHADIEALGRPEVAPRVAGKTC